MRFILLERALPFDPNRAAAKTRNPIGRAMNKEAVQMFATPAGCILKDFVVVRRYWLC